MEAPSAAELKTKWENTSWHSSRNPKHPRDDLNLRVRRALSWLEQARDEHHYEDYDLAFILYWIAFNAAYGQTGSLPTYDQRERTNQRDYFRKVVGLDPSLHQVLATEDVLRPMEALLDSKYVFEPFWKHLNRVPGNGNWAERLDRSKRKAKSGMDYIKRTSIVKREIIVEILCAVFERLYTLRNQLLHGGATWNSSVNRNQVQQGAAVMSLVVPRFIDVMIENPDADWGTPRYPVVKD